MTPADRRRRALLLVCLITARTRMSRTVPRVPSASRLLLLPPPRWINDRLPHTWRISLTCAPPVCAGSRHLSSLFTVLPFCNTQQFAICLMDAASIFVLRWQRAACWTLPRFRFASPRASHSRQTPALGSWDTCSFHAVQDRHAGLHSALHVCAYAARALFCLAAHFSLLPSFTDSCTNAPRARSFS